VVLLVVEGKRKCAVREEAEKEERRKGANRTAHKQLAKR